MRKLIGALLLCMEMAAAAQITHSAIPCKMGDCGFSVAYSSITGITASRLLGRGSASAGAAQEITLGTGLTMTGTTLAASGGGLSGGTAQRLGIWTAADAMSSHAGLLADATTGALTIGAQSDIVPMTLRAYSSGTSHIAQWQNSSNGALGEITHTGGLRLWGLYSGGGTDYESYTLLATAGSGVTLAAATGGAGVDNLGINLSPVGTGKVGIATVSPARKLHVTDAVGGPQARFAYDADYYLDIGYAELNGVYPAGGANDLWISTTGATAGNGSVWILPGRVSEVGAVVTKAGVLAASTALGLLSGTGSTSDVALYRDAAGTLAQRNTTNAQTHRVYGTYTDASNYVRASLSATSTAVTLAAETAGTGADDVDVNLTAAGAGKIKLNSQLLKTAFDTAPANATDTGTAGEVRITATYIYVCTAANTWVRAALATW